ncbi:hypothetical protein K491DRAFT_128645 [Lophiostoma macrostomum CBS 122681]|uniref:F-box domain-containing protein n=1 Tax=Lophiostoma macrostomum CBS 122681 TaxID=1314788 RepID=A0A6A6SUB1_9PLEO|nr:hypothetical protein K491DRAFT_128645 [Lophiostoma macrostomum CBS 122681]
MPSSTNMDPIFEEDLLARLPSELRNMVYGELFFNEDKTIHGNRKEQNKLAIFATSRLYHHETSSFFYARSHFILEGGPKPADGAATILPPISDRYVRYLKQVTIVVNTGHTSLPPVREAAATLTALIDAEASFEEVTIRIKPPQGIPMFSNSRFDDSIMDANHSIVGALERILSAQIAKIIRIELCHTWFGPGIATRLNDLFMSGPSTTSGKHLLFIKGDEPSQKSVIHDLSECERPGRGIYYRATINNWDNFDLTLNYDIDGRLGSPASDGSFESLVDLDIASDALEFLELFPSSDENDSISDDEFTPDDDVEDDVMDEDDMDIANLISGEGNKTLENMVTFAPHLLLV